MMHRRNRHRIQKYSPWKKLLDQKNIGSKMPAPIDKDFTDNEGWGAYRKLIVETLRRLDEYITDIKQEQDHQKTRIQVLENKTTDKRLDDIEADIERIDKAISVIQTSTSNDDLRKKWIMTIGAAAWGIIVIVIATYININFFH